MNIQIYGKNKCFDTRKAQRYFQERRVKFQFIDLPRYGMGPRELENVARAVGVWTTSSTPSTRTPKP